MNIQSIKYLVALAKYSHFGKAAKMCFVSQPTLSMQIKKLEDRLGVQLLERTNKSVRLTEIGAQMAERGKNILREMEAMREEAQAAKDPYSGQIKLGIIPTVAPYLLPLAFPKLMHIFPKLSYFLVEGQTHFLLEELNQGKIDAAILALPITDTHLNTAAFFTEEFLLAAPHEHAWSRRKTLKLTELGDQNLLLLNEGHCLRDQALAVCEQISANEMKDFRATSLETLRHMVAAGIGITLMPKLACRKGDGLVYIPFNGAKPSRSLGLVWRKSTSRSLLFNELVGHLKNICLNSISL